MNSFLRTVDHEASVLAQRQIADVLAQAVSIIDDRLEKLAEAVQLAVKQKKFLHHRMHEHTAATLKGCSCELCEVYKEIDHLKVLRRSCTYPRMSEEHPHATLTAWLKSIDYKLFTLHNMRRQLMGLPLKEKKPVWIKNSNAGLSSRDASA